MKILHYISIATLLALLMWATMKYIFGYFEPYFGFIIGLVSGGVTDFIMKWGAKE
jgi:multisubunit Na+/H+ antiporter MnhE subunit